MKITTRFIYGLKFIEYLYRKGCIVKMNRISKSLNLSRKYLEKLSRSLSENGIIKSTRGPSGGYCLKAGDEITLLDVYNALEGKVEEGKCFEAASCKAKKCKTSEILEDVNNEIRSFLDNRKLSEYFEEEE